LLFDRINNLESSTLKLEQKIQANLYALKTRIQNIGNTDNAQTSHLSNRIEYLESSKLELEQKIQTNLQAMETRIKNLENTEHSFNNSYPSSISESSTLTGLTQYYLLQGLTERLIKEVQSSKDIQYLQKIEGNRMLAQKNLKYVQNVAKHSQWLSEIVITYHNDHGCSRQEAEQLSAELNQLALKILMIRSVFDLKVMYGVVLLFTHQISRFKHRKSKYCWNYSMREKMLNILNDC
jgi:hypothetical protein